MSTIALNLVDTFTSKLDVPEGVIAPSNGKICGTGCSGSTTKTKPLHNHIERIPFAERRLNLDAVPTYGMSISSIDMDLTVECNLRCTYCFKEKWNEHMEEQVAYDTITWLIHASSDVKDIHIAFMGGEPLLRFKLMQKIVPFGKRRAAHHGKKLNFSMTTNCTLVTDEVVSFWDKWGLGFHTSIDGTPDIQDVNRPTTSGKPSSRLVERSVPKILSSQSNTTARCTVVPSSAGKLYSSFKYFRKLGYLNIAFVPGAPSLWSAQDVSTYEDEYRKVAYEVMDELRNGIPVILKGLDDAARARELPVRSEHSCGAGRGLVLVDIHGDLWPCHRWNKDSEQDWKIGSIYDTFSETARSQLDCDSFINRLQNGCDKCCANIMCSGGCPAENLEETGSVYKRHKRACDLTRIWAQVGNEVYDIMKNEGNQLFEDTYCDVSSDKYVE
jgi:uncharacterized protein